MRQPSVLLMLLALALALTSSTVPLCAGGQPGKDTITVKLRPLAASFQVGEPVRIELRFENRGEKAVNIDLGTSDVSALRVSWKPPRGKVVKRRGVVAGGLRRHLRLKVKAGGSATHEFLLNKLITIPKPGEFRLTVSVDRAGTASGSITVVAPSKETTKRLKAAIVEWFGAARNPRTPANKRVVALENLVYTRSVDALPHQRELFSGRWIDHDQRTALVPSMLASDSDGTVTQLFAELLEKKDSPHRGTILYGLKSFGVKNLGSDSQRLLEPWAREIEKAAPVVISG